MRVSLIKVLKVKNLGWIWMGGEIPEERPGVDACLLAAELGNCRELCAANDPAGRDAGGDLREPGNIPICCGHG